MWERLSAAAEDVNWILREGRSNFPNPARLPSRKLFDSMAPKLVCRTNSAMPISLIGKWWEVLIG